jgi:hypothetical protein
LRGLRLAGFLVLVIVGATALLLTVLWGKEGFGREDLPVCLAGLAVLAGAGLLWWLLCRRVRPLASDALLGAGLGVLVLPGLLYALFAVRTTVNTIRGASLARRASITGFREAGIVWPGFRGPVGLWLELDLVVPARLQGNLLSPRLALGGPAGFTARDYFSSPFYRLEGRVLTQPLFPLPDRATEPSLADGEPVHLSYRLYPGYVRQLEPGTRVCVDTAAIARAHRNPDPPAESELAASWLFAGPGALTVDLSPVLTAKLREQSRWARNAEALDSLLDGLTPPALGAAGFSPCSSRGWPGDECWCRAVT